MNLKFIKRNEDILEKELEKEEVEIKKEEKVETKEKNQK